MLAQMVWSTLFFHVQNGHFCFFGGVRMLARMVCALFSTFWQCQMSLFDRGEGSKATWAMAICKQHILKRGFSICVDSDKFAVGDGWEGNRSFSTTSVLCPALCLECTVHHSMQKWGPQKSWAVLKHSLQSLIDDTKILTETDTDTFFPIPNFLKRRHFFRYLFPRPNSPKPITLKNCQKSRDRGGS